MQNTAQRRRSGKGCKGKMSKQKKKQKFALWVTEETMKKVEKLYREENVKSRSEFIEKAINFYCGYHRYAFVYRDERRGLAGA